MNKSSRILLIMPPQKPRIVLLASLESLDSEVVIAENCRQARGLLQSDPPLDVVITHATLSDGNWCDVIANLVQSGSDASVIVTSAVADERMWSEVLWRGAYDILVQPYESFEVRRVIEGALRAGQPNPLPVGTKRPPAATNRAEVSSERSARSQAKRHGSSIA